MTKFQSLLLSLLLICSGIYINAAKADLDSADALIKYQFNKTASDTKNTLLDGFEADSSSEAGQIAAVAFGNKLVAKDTKKKSAEDVLAQKIKKLRRQNNVRGNVFKGKVAIEGPLNNITTISSNEHEIDLENVDLKIACNEQIATFSDANGSNLRNVRNDDIAESENNVIRSSFTNSETDETSNATLPVGNITLKTVIDIERQDCIFTIKGDIFNGSNNPENKIGSFNIRAVQKFLVNFDGSFSVDLSDDVENGLGVGAANIILNDINLDELDTTNGESNIINALGGNADISANAIQGRNESGQATASSVNDANQIVTKTQVLDTNGEVIKFNIYIPASGKIFDLIKNAPLGLRIVLEANDISSVFGAFGENDNEVVLFIGAFLAETDTQIEIIKTSDSIITVNANNASIVGPFGSNLGTASFSANLIIQNSENNPFFANGDI